MMRHALLALLVLYDIQAHITDQPSFADRLNHIYEKLDKFTIAPTKKLNSKLYAKLDRLNSLTPGEITDEDEELLSAMQMWGTISDDQLKGVVQEFQRLKEEDKSDRGDEYSDGDWNDDDLDYANDDGEEWGDPIDEETSSTSRPIIGVTPSAFTRLDGYRHTIVSAVDPIAATNERPRILDDSHATTHERVSLRKAAIANVRNVIKSGNCLVPQPRWFFVRKLAPAADTVYMPPCVQLHRCAPDSGCCYDEAEVCAPVDGKYVAIPFLLTKTDQNLTAARILFFNHTRCACVSRDTLQSTMRTRIEHREDRKEDRTESKDERREESIERVERREDSRDTERQNDWREPTEEPILKKDEDQTAPPQLRRCTCPTLFRNRIKDGICSCVCEWPDTTRKRNCLSLARGKEHFGLRDRVCLERGDCTTPSCEYGAYDRSIGRCPYRRVKRRYSSRRYHRV